MNILDRVLQHEGFRRQVYRDHLGNLTFGHGLTFITEAESEYIVDKRLANFAEQHISKRPWLVTAPPIVLDVVTEMAFQMGFAGTNAFVNMWFALYDQNYSRAADEMLDSRWAKQTSERANELADLMREAAE